MENMNKLNKKIFHDKNIDIYKTDYTQPFSQQYPALSFVLWDSAFVKDIQWTNRVQLFKSTPSRSWNLFRQVYESL